VPGEAFSVLLPVYAGDHPRFLVRAFESVTFDQERPPNQVVIVRDGPVSQPIVDALEDLVKRSPVPLTIVDLPENRGLGSALSVGMKACRYNIVARMDADDVSLPARFLRQLPLIESGFDLVGASLAEIGSDEGDLRGVRRPPIEHEDILRFGRFHAPFNHPTVVLRRQTVLEAGGYQELPHLEDYWLWARMLAAGARATNVDEPLVLYRAEGGYRRRGGWSLARSEIDLQIKMRRLRFTSKPQFIRNLILRVGWRLSPTFLRRPIYRRIFLHGGTDVLPLDGS
jgi:glycosyltransferase involved in cell wall biosynthesis